MNEPASQPALSTSSKSSGTEDGCTRSLIGPGAPLMKSNAVPAGESSAIMTTPDRRVWELNSRVLSTVSLAVRASDM